MRFLGCSVAWLLLVSLSLRNFLSCSLIRSETNRINVSWSTRKVAIPWPMWKGEKEFLWWWLHDRIVEKRKRENSFFHKRAKTFPRDLSLFPLVSHVYRLTKNEERVAKDSQQEAWRSIHSAPERKKWNFSLTWTRLLFSPGSSFIERCHLP